MRAKSATCQRFLYAYDTNQSTCVSVGDESGVHAEFPYGGELTVDVQRRERVAFVEGDSAVDAKPLDGTGAACTGKRQASAWGNRAYRHAVGIPGADS